MTRFTTCPAPVSTLWGKPDTAVQILPGIWEVTTPSHGGFVLSDERQAAMPDELRLDGVFYEEDCDWARVLWIATGQGRALMSCECSSRW